MQTTAALSALGAAANMVIWAADPPLVPPGPETLPTWLAVVSFAAAAVLALGGSLPVVVRHRTGSDISVRMAVLLLVVGAAGFVITFALTLAYVYVAIPLLVAGAVRESTTVNVIVAALIAAIGLWLW